MSWKSISALFVARLAELQDGRSDDVFAAWLGVSRENLKSWRKGHTPRGDAVAHMAEQAKVTTDWLLGVPGAVKFRASVLTSDRVDDLYASVSRQTREWIAGLVADAAAVDGLTAEDVDVDVGAFFAAAGKQVGTLAAQTLAKTEDSRTLQRSAAALAALVRELAGGRLEYWTHPETGEIDWGPGLDGDSPEWRRDSVVAFAESRAENIAESLEPDLTPLRAFGVSVDRFLARRFGDAWTILTDDAYREVRTLRAIAAGEADAGHIWPSDPEHALEFTRARRERDRAAREMIEAFRQHWRDELPTAKANGQTKRKARKRRS